MTKQWQELKETIAELRDSNGTCTQQEVCKFLVNYMDILEKQNCIPKPDDLIVVVKQGATNGDMIKTVFPNIEIEGIEGLEGLQCVAVNIGLGTSYFALDWWNAQYPYEAERHTCGECQKWGTVNCSQTYREPTYGDNVCESFKAEREE